MSTNKNLDYQLYVQRENEFVHEPYKNEAFIYNAIKQGNVELIEENQSKYGNHAPNGKGNLSENPLRSQIYHMVINTAMITRVCAGAGLPYETAYTLSDLYIRQADICKTVDEVMKLNDKMVIEFALQMKQLKNKDILYSSVRKTINYICDNLHKKITVAELAHNVGHNRSYFSVLFKKQTGKSIHEYITDKRIQAAMNMLSSSDFSYSEIASTLCFASQSYFCKCFKESTGYTPNEYRNKSNIGEF